jgi:hypothetical protein
VNTRHACTHARAHAHTHTRTRVRDSQGWQHCVVIALVKYLAGTTGKVEKANVLSLESVRKDGRRLDKFYVIICMNSTQLEVQFIIHFLPVSSGSQFHTHAFRSLLCVFCVLITVHVTPVTSHQHMPHHGYNAVAGDSGAGSHLLRTNRHSLPTKWVEKVGKLKYCGFTHNLRPPPDQGEDVCKVWFRNVDLYKFHTNKHSSLYIRLNRDVTGKLY